MLNRRHFLGSSLAALAAARLHAGPTSMPPPDDVFLNKLTFGATPVDRNALMQMGREGWLNDQLSRPAFDKTIEDRIAAQTLRIHYEAGEDPGTGSWPALDEARPLRTLHADPATLLPLIDWDRALPWEERARPGDEVIAAALTRAVHAPGQLREVMTQFWHDHFNVSAYKNEYTSIYFPSYDQMLRANAFGNIRTLLGAVATSPAMLVYLNNDESRASPANENFARELLELHTLGAAAYLNTDHPNWSDVPRDSSGLATGYIDQDVYEVARAFTGWTIGDGRWISEGRYAPETGRFHYEEGWHDPYQKRILAREMGPNRAPMADGHEVLDILAAHPATARHICTKLARRFVSDSPSEGLILALTDSYHAHANSDDQIAQIIRTLVSHPEFDSRPSKLRRPFEFMAALYRASGAKITSPEGSYHWQLARAGWQQHSYPPPTGHPDTAEAWLTGTYLLRLTEMALYAHEEWFGSTRSALSDHIPAQVRTVGDLTGFWTQRLHGTADDTLPELLAGMGLSAGDPLPDSTQDRDDLSSTILAFAALSPQVLYR